MRTAKSWGLTPQDWRAASLDDRALMLAYDLFNNTRDAYREEWKEDRDKKLKKQKEKGVNPWEAMKQQMKL